MKTMKTMKTWDFWDTLITRLVPSPTQIFSIVEQVSTHVNFATLRIKAEQIVRAKFEEVTIDQIYDQLNYPLDLRKKLMSLELDAEIKYSAPILKNVQEFKPEDLILTDMYLPRNTLEVILSKCGLSYRSENLFISSELKLSKASGRMFTYVSRQFPGVTFSHRGDNRESDVRRAKAAGYRVSHERLAELTKAEQMWCSLGVLYTAGCIRATRLAQPPLAKSRSRVWELAASTIAPAIYAFSLWILRSARESGISKIVFLSRDGYLPYEFCKRLSATSDEFLDLQLIYAYGSRQALHLPSYDGDITSAATWLLDATETSLRDLANRSLISLDRLVKIYADQHPQGDGVLADIPLSKEELSHIVYSTQFQVALNESASKARSSAISYWESIGALGNPADTRIGLVDIGWNGRMQNSVAKLLHLSGQKSELTGLYFGLAPTARGIFPRQKMLSFTEYVANDESTWAPQSANFLEYLFPAPHPSVWGYRLDQSCSATVEFCDGSDNIADLEIRNIIINAAIHFIKYRVQLPTDANFGPLVSALQHLAISPTRADALAFIDAKHSDAQGDVMSASLISGISPLIAAFQSHRYRFGYWKEGTFALHRLIFALQCYRLLKRHLVGDAKRPQPA